MVIYTLRSNFGRIYSLDFLLSKLTICKTMDVDSQDIFRQREDPGENPHFVDIRHLSTGLQAAIQLIVDDLSLQARMLEMQAHKRKPSITKK
ncbi:hypothetical protein SAMN03159353_10327 [Cedecea sp. NFIX57]|nr:hypothetical protein SAMN03159353_10327 [Cedecea sp. NFIX57]